MMSIQNQNELENFGEGEFKDLRELLNKQSKKWKEEKPFYFALKMLIQDFWKYIFTLVSSKSNAENLLNKNMSCGEIKKILEQENSNIDQKFRELVSNRKFFLIDKVELSKEDFDKKMDFYLNKVFSIFNKIKENESLIKDNMSLYERSKLNKKLSPDILIETVKGYIKNEIPFLSENLKYRNRVASPSQENFDNKLLQEILSDVNAFREDLKYGEHPDNEKQLGINYILFLLKFYKFLKISIADKRNFGERMYIKVEYSKILESKKIKEEKKNFLNNLRHFIDPYKNKKQTQAKLIRFSMEKNLFSFLKIIKNSNAEQDNIKSILKNGFNNIRDIKDVLIPTLEETMQNKSENNICGFEFIENNSSIKNFIRIFRILEIHYSTLENRKILFEKYSRFNWYSFKEHNEYNISSNIPNGDASAPQIYIDIERNQIIKRLINFLENEMYLIYFRENQKSGDSRIKILGEKFRFDNKPKDSFIRLLTELINILEYRKIKKQANNFNEDSNISKEEKEQILNIQTELKLKFLKQIKKSGQKEDLLKKAIDHITNTRYEEALCSLTRLLEKCEPININFLRYLVSNTEKANEKIKDKEIVLLLGNTGVGKSTLTLFFSGIKLIQNERGELVPEQRNYDNPELHNIIPEGGLNSETRLLTGIENSSANLNKTEFSSKDDTYIICDSPGFNDTRGIETEISNSIGLLNGIKNSKSVLPVLVMTDKFGERFQPFIQLLKTMMGMLNSPSEILPKFLFFMNNCSEENLKKFIAMLDDIKRNVRKKLEDEDEDFLTFVEDICQVLIEKVIRIDPLNDDYRDIVKNVILKDPKRYLKRFSSVFKLPFSEKTNMKVNEFFQSCKDFISCSLKTIQEIEFVDDELEVNLNLISYHVSNLNYLNENYDIEEKIDSIKNELKNFLRKEYQDQKQMLEKALKLENNLLEEDLIKYTRGYKINKAFHERLGLFLRENSIKQDAYITNFINYFNVLLKSLSLSSKEEIENTNKALKKLKMMLNSSHQLEESNAKSNLEIEFMEKFEERITGNILETQDKYQILFDNKQYEELFAQQYRMNTIVLYSKNVNSGFSWAFNFYQHFEIISGNNNNNNNNNNNLRENVFHINTEKIERVENYKKYLKVFFEKQDAFAFLENKIINLSDDILKVFEIDDPKILKEQDIDNLKDVLNSLEIFKEFKYGKINKKANEAIEKIGKKVEEYLDKLIKHINEILDGKQNLDHQNDDWDQIKSDITKDYIHLEDFFNIIAKIQSIEKLTIYTYKQNMYCCSSVEKFFKLFENNLLGIYKEITLEFKSKDNKLKNICNRLKEDFRIIYESQFLRDRKKDSLEDLKKKFAGKIINLFSEYFDTYNLSNFKPTNFWAISRKNYHELFSIVNNLNSILKLKDEIPDLKELESKIDDFNSICEKILKNIKEGFSEEELKLNERLKKTKVIKCIEICRYFVENLYQANPYYEKFEDTKNEISEFLKKFMSQKIMNPINSFLKEINNFKLIDYYDQQKLEELKIKVDYSISALEELKVLKENYESLLGNMIEEYADEDGNEYDYKHIQEKIVSCLNYVTEQINIELEEEFDILDEKYDTIQHITGTFEKFESLFILNKNFREIKAELKSKFLDEKKLRLNDINERKYEEIILYLKDIPKENHQDKKRLFSELTNKLKKNLQDLITTNKIQLNKLKNSDFESGRYYICEIFKNLKSFKDIKETKDIHEDNNNQILNYDEILLQYDNSRKELDEFFKKISEDKTDIDNLNFDMYLKKKDFLARNLKEYDEDIDKGYPLNQLLLNNFTKLFENKMKEIVDSYQQSMGNFIEKPLKEICKQLDTVNLKKEKENLEKEIYNILNDCLNSENKENFKEKINMIENLKKYYIKFFPKSLVERSKILCEEVEKKLNSERQEKITQLNQYINTKQYKESNLCWGQIKNYDTDGTISEGMEKFVMNELWYVVKNIEEHYNKGDYDEMYSDILNFENMINISKDNFSKITDDIFNYLKKFTESMLTKETKYMENLFKKDKEISDLDLQCNLSNLNYQYNSDNFVTYSDKSYKTEVLSFSCPNLLEQTLIFRKKHKKLYLIYIENSSENSIFKFMTFILENIQSAINSFEELLLNLGRDDFSYFNNSYLNIEKYIKAIKRFKEKLFGKKKDMLGNMKTTSDDIIYYNKEIFFDEDIENESIKKCLNMYKSFSSKAFGKKMKDHISNIKLGILEFRLNNTPKENDFESLVSRIEFIQKLVERKIYCEESILFDILNTKQGKVRESFKKITGITGDIRLNSLLISKDDIINLGNIYENLKTFNNKLGKLFSKNNIDLGIESNLAKVEQSLKSIFTEIIDNCFVQYSKSFSELEKISKILIYLKIYSINLKFMKDYIENLIDSMMERTKKTEKDNIPIKTLGDLLSEDFIGKIILEDSIIFKGYKDRNNYNEPTTIEDIKDILGKIKAENIELNMKSKIIGLNKSSSSLKEYYDSYLNFYEKYLNQTLHNQNQEKRFENLLGLLRLKIHFKINHKPERSMWNYDMVSQIPEILAIISVIWTLTFSTYYFEISTHDREDKYLNKPHVNQILTILCLLCIDKNELKIFNNLVSTGMGKGKSTVIALIAALLALYGFNVNVLWSNISLCSKDHSEYFNFYQRLGVSKYIFYGDYKTIGQRIINENGDLREITKKSLKEDSRIESMSNQNMEEVSIKRESNFKNYDNKDSNGHENSDFYYSNYRPNLLLINEISVLFDKTFNGYQYMQYFTYKHENINALFDFIWQKHTEFLEIQKANNSSFDYEEEKSKRYDKFYNELVLSSHYIKCSELLNSSTDSLSVIVKDILSDLVDLESFEYIIVNDKIAYKDNDIFIENYDYRYKTIFAYYKEFDKKKISEKSLKQNIYFIINCGDFSYPEIFKRFKHIIGVSETLMDLTDTQKEKLGTEFKILKYVYMPGSIADANLWPDN